MPTSPTGTSPSPTRLPGLTPLPSATPPPPVMPPTSFPPLSGPSRTFIFKQGLLAYPVQEQTENSRFVLYDNGAFGLQDLHGGGHHRGSYTAENGALYFTFETNFGQWTASGSLEGDSLEDQVQLHDEFGRLRERRVHSDTMTASAA